MAEDEAVASRRRPSVGARHDLDVCAAHADGEALDQHRTVGVGRFVDVFEPGRARGQGLDRERLHRARSPLVLGLGLAGVSRGDRSWSGGGRTRASPCIDPDRPKRLPALRSSRSSAIELLLHAGMAREVVGGVDERHVGEGLREVAHLPSGPHVVLLGQQPEVVAQTDQPVEHGVGVVVAADQVETVGHPERTGQEGTLVTGEPVHRAGVLGAVAQHEAVLGEPPLDDLDRRPHPLVGGGEEARRAAS